MRTLIFGTMPDHASPQTHTASGPWCFTGQEDAFPGWWKKDGFPLPPDPFPTPQDVADAAAHANAAANSLLPLFGNKLASRLGVPYQEKFWEMALGPWLLLFTHMLIERQTRVELLVSFYGSEQLCVPLLAPHKNFGFKNSLDFMLRGVLNHTFNHYVFSRIVEAMAPKTWQMEYTPCPDVFQPQPPQSTGQRIRKRLHDLLLRLPFPVQKGFSVAESLKLSLAVAANRNPESKTLPFSVYGSTPIIWKFPALDLMDACLPADLLTGKAPRIPKAAGKLRGMTAAFSQDDAYRIFLGAWLAGGGKLFSIQHGANYGNLESVGILPFEYKQHAFFSWGWSTSHAAEANAVPMPHPALCKLHNAYSRQNEAIILVGTEMSPYSYRLKSRPAAAAQVAYRERKIIFFKELSETIRKQAQYRPYPGQKSFLEDAPFVQRHVPGIPICTGDLTGHMLGCKLLVLDHYGTTLHMAFAANTPTVCFWAPEDWGMDAASQTHLARLRDAGILFDSPAAAAKKINAVWPEVAGWWQTPSIQAARQGWLSAYALCTLPADGAGTSAKPEPSDVIRHWQNILRQC